VVNGRTLTLGLVGALAVAGAVRQRGSAARDPYAPIRALGYSDAEIQRALTAAGQGPTALERGDKSTQTAGPTRQGAYPGLDFRPPSEVRKEALEGLRLRKENERRGKRVDPKTGAGPGGWWIGVGRAIQLATLPAMPPREISRMRDYFRRHAVDMKSAGAARGQATPGVVAWRLWGGTEGRARANQLARQMEEMDAGRKGKRGSRSLAERGARLTAELARRPRRYIRARGSRNADPTVGLSEPLERLYGILDLSDAQKAEELAYSASWLLWQGLSEGGHDALADAYEESGYDTEDILPRIKDELGKGWLERWYDDYYPQLLQQDAAEAPSFLFFDRPKVLRNAWLVHFTADAEKVARQGFRRGVEDPMRVGLTTLLSQSQKRTPGYTFAFRPEDVNRYAWSRGRPKYGKEAVVFRADAIFAYHTSDEEDQAIAWGPEAKDIRAVWMDGRNPVLTNENGENVVYDDFPSLIEDLEAGRV
jgi:hypothetical protein